MRSSLPALVALLLLLPVVRAFAADDDRDAFGKQFERAILSQSPPELGAEDRADIARIVTHPGITAAKADQDYESNPMLRPECVTEAIRVRTQMVGATQARSDIAKWKEKLAGGQMSEGEYWKEIMECKDYCAQIMVDTLNCYVQAASRQFRGIFLFDYGVGDYQPVTRGDVYSSGRIHDNERVMTQMVAALLAHPDQHALLEGRASRTGNDIVNFHLAGKRAGAVRDELMKRGVDMSRLHFRWIGEGEPYYRENLAQLFQITDKYASFGQETLNQSVTVYLFTPGAPG